MILCYAWCRLNTSSLAIQSGHKRYEITSETAIIYFVQNEFDYHDGLECCVHIILAEAVISDKEALN